MIGLSRHGRLAPAAIACLVVGLVLMIPFDLAVTRLLGVAALVAFIVLGTVAVATPEYLARDPDRDE